MISAINSALFGLTTATAKLSETAAKIAGSATATDDPTSFFLADSPSAAAPAGTAFNDSLLLFVADTSFVADLFDLKEAEILYKASATLLGSIDDVQKQLVDVIG